MSGVQGDMSDSGPMIVLDECHKAKNLLNDHGLPTQTGFAVEYIQELCPNAAVLYSSATGISEPNNMAYMTRLGTFGHEDMPALIKNLVDSGLGASELFSCSLKASGIYLARYARLQSVTLSWIDPRTRSWIRSYLLLIILCVVRMCLAIRKSLRLPQLCATYQRDLVLTPFAA